MAKSVTTKELNDLLAELYQYDMPEFEVRTDYSGRFMYGKNCIGFVTNNPTLILMALTAALIHFEHEADENDEDYTYPLWQDLTVGNDSMGYDAIVYFPNWRVED